jgi:hypothetical protein
MPYQLTFSELINEQTRDVGENVFLDNLPSDYNVYLFYYPGAMPNETLESHLRNLGNSTGKNLFVNFGKLNDPNYSKIANLFQIKNLPVIVMTAVADLASPVSSYFNVYIRIDNKKLIDNPDKTVEFLQKLFNLFISGNVAEALNEVKKDDRKLLIASFTKVVGDALKGLGKFISETDISFSVVEGKFELKRS